LQDKSVVNNLHNREYKVYDGITTCCAYIIIFPGS